MCRLSSATLALSIAPREDKVGMTASAASLHGSAAQRGSATQRRYGAPPGHFSGRGAVLAVLPAMSARLADAATTHGASGHVDCNAATQGCWDGLIWADGVAHRLDVLVLGNGAHGASESQHIQILLSNACMPTTSASAPLHCGQRREGNAAIHLGRIAVADPARRFL